MKIKELMTEDAVVLDPESTIEEAAQAMADADVGSLPVLRGSRAVGILTDRDVVVRVVAEGLSPAETKVEQAMTSEVVHCSQDDDVEEAARIMAAEQVRRIIVLDDAGKFVGVVSLADLALNTAERAGGVLQEVSRPAEELSQGIYTGGPAKADHDGDSDVAALVKDELAAIDTYKQVLQTIPGGKAGAGLRRIEDEHEEAAKLLKERLLKLGMDAPRSSGAEGAWAKAHEKSAELSDPKTTIKLLKEGEELEIADYEKALRDEALDSGLKTLISSRLLPKARARLPVLERYLHEGPVA